MEKAAEREVQPGMRGRIVEDSVVRELGAAVLSGHACEEPDEMTARLHRGPWHGHRQLGVDPRDVQDRLALEVEDGRVLAAVRDLENAAAIVAVIDQECLITLAAERRGAASHAEEAARELRRLVGREAGRLRLEHAHGHGADPMRKTFAMPKGAWSAELELVGAGGEAVDLWRTLTSHGVAHLPPNRLDEDGRALETTVALPRRRARTIRISAGRPGFARVESTDVGGRDAVLLVEAARHMLRLDADLSSLYEAAREDPELSWAAAGAGRMLRSPTVFEDVVKTICTTNCAWSATVRMVSALVDHLGEQAAPIGDERGRRTFPTPAAMAEADDVFYTEKVRAGYRGAYLRTLAAAVAGGELDLESLAQASPEELPDDEIAARLLELPGVGPYAAAHVIMLLRRYSRLLRASE